MLADRTNSSAQKQKKQLQDQSVADRKRKAAFPLRKAFLQVCFVTSCFPTMAHLCHSEENLLQDAQTWQNDISSNPKEKREEKATLSKRYMIVKDKEILRENRGICFKTLGFFSIHLDPLNHSAAWEKSKQLYHVRSYLYRRL